MIVGGDEQLHSQKCNNNPYNLDSPATWLTFPEVEPAFTTIARRLMQFRAAHSALRHATWIEPAQIAWRDANGASVNGAYLDDATRPVLAWQLDGAALGDSSASIYVAYNGWSGQVTATLPALPAGRAWYRVVDTAAWMESSGNAVDAGQEAAMLGTIYDLAARSVIVLIER